MRSLLKVLKSRRIKDLSVKYFFPNTDLLKRLFFQSAPISAALLLISVGNFIILTYIGVFGEYAVAGFGSATRFEQILLLPVLGLNTAIISIIGQNFGAKNFLRVKESYFTAIKMLVFKMNVWIFQLKSKCILLPSFTIIGEGSGEIGSDVTEEITGPSANMAETSGGTNATGIFHNTFYSNKNVGFKSLLKYS